MWQRFTERARKVIVYAQEEAVRFGHPYVSTEHLLLGLIRESDNLASRILGVIGVDLGRIRTELEQPERPGEAQPGQDLLLTPRAKQVIDFAYVEARDLGDNYLGAEHLLLGLIREGEGIAAKVLATLGVTAEAVRESLLSVKLRNAAQSEELLTLDEAVKFLGTSKPTLYRLLGQDEIKGLKVGRQWRFRKTDLTAYLQRGMVALTAAPKEDLNRELTFFSEKLGEKDTDVSGDAEAKTERLADLIIRLAIESKASDIHLDPTAEDLLLRFRADGVLQETRHFPASVRKSLTAQFKKMADIEMSEKSLPQDGRIPVRYVDKEFELRLASIPSVYGEALTMGILRRSDALVGLDMLDLTPEDLRQVRDFLNKPNGVFLATGPTGSGKMTLLYNCLRELADMEKKTMTLEDPVDSYLLHTTQVQVNKKVGLTYAAGLRAFLRQDPDIILVGETLDLETANLIVEGSLTGHLILTSLQAGDTLAALQWLMDMGDKPQMWMSLITSTVVGVVAMRLCRRLCTHCKLPMDLSAQPMLSYVVRLAAEGGYTIPNGAVFYKGRGCMQCRGRGYNGRIALYEVLTMTDPLTEALLRHASPEEMIALAIASGMRTLLADGIRKAVEGQTTIEEVLRVVSVSV